MYTCASKYATYIARCHVLTKNACILLYTEETSNHIYNKNVEVLKRLGEHAMSCDIGAVKS